MNKDALFWDNLANMYNGMFAKSKAYQQMYSLMRAALNKDMKVLEIGTASGLVARAVSDTVKEVHAIDFSQEMIANAQKLTAQQNIFFSVQDSASLQFDEAFFDAVIIANVLHIIENPQATLKEIKRVLKPDGMLIAPTYLWKEHTFFGKIQKFFMLRRGFPIHSEWNSEEYRAFLKQNGFSSVKQEIIKGSFNICYAEVKAAEY